MKSNDLAEINACLAGQTDAFGRLVDRYQDRLYSALFRVLRNSQDTQDVLQETFLQAFNSLNSFQQSSGFYTWLYRIAMNAAITMRRKRRPITGIEPKHGRLGASVPDSSHGNQPDERLEVAEDMQQLETALARLSKRDRALLLMKSVEGHSYQTISETLGIPFGTVRSRLHRARMKLRRVLEGAGSHLAAAIEME